MEAQLLQRKRIRAPYPKFKGKFNPGPLEERLFEAIRENDFTGFKRALADGANPKISSSGTALMHASGFGRIGMMLDLLGRGDIDIDEGDGFLNPLMAASRDGQHQAVKFLIENGANIWAYGMIKYDSLIFATLNDKTSVIELLLDSGAEIEYRCDDGKTAFFHAVEERQFGAAELLLDRGADIEASWSRHEYFPFTPLCMAVSGQDKEMIRFLVERGANVDVDSILEILRFGFVMGSGQFAKMLMDGDLEGVSSFLASGREAAELFKSKIEAAVGAPLAERIFASLQNTKDSEG